MRSDALIILGGAVIVLGMIGIYWAALILAFAGALAIMGMPQGRSKEKEKRNWTNVPPVPDAGDYPGWDFWVKHIENATKSVMDILRTFTGIHYAVDNWGDIIKKKIWDADIPTEWRYHPEIGIYTAHKKTSDAIIYALYKQIQMEQIALQNAKTPEERKYHRERLKKLWNAFTSYIRSSTLPDINVDESEGKGSEGKK